MIICKMRKNEIIIIIIMCLPETNILFYLHLLTDFRAKVACFKISTNRMNTSDPVVYARLRYARILPTTKYAYIVLLNVCCILLYIMRIRIPCMITKFACSNLSIKVISTF